MKENKVGNYTR